jgi:hypothetical protein
VYRSIYHASCRLADCREHGAIGASDCSACRPYRGAEEGAEARTPSSQGKVIRIYKVALGGDPVGPKTRQGDHKTPEGKYVLDFRNSHSKFYKAIHISYPSEHDRALPRQNGFSPGGDVFVHGLPNGYGAIGAAHRLKDWTDGCIAVTNEEIDEIWKAVPDGTQIEIKPESRDEFGGPGRDRTDDLLHAMVVRNLPAIDSK